MDGGMCFYCLTFIALILVLYIMAMIYSLIYTNATNLSGKHVFITGGSSGIGKSIALEAAQRGAHITIAARNKDKLLLAKSEILNYVVNKTQVIETVSLDVTSSYSQIEESLLQSEKTCGPIFILVNCAGSAACGILEDLDETTINNQFKLNIIGSIMATKAVLPGMKERREGHIVFLASQAAYIGIYGLSAYSGSKFALRGFSEALQMEVQSYNLKVTVAYPPDTDTPGFAEEEILKPKETKLISESSGLFEPNDVAKKILSDTLEGKFSSNVGLDGFLLETMCCGMSPVNSILDVINQISFMGLFRLIGLFFHLSFGRIIMKCFLEKTKPKKEL